MGRHGLFALLLNLFAIYGFAHANDLDRDEEIVFYPTFAPYSASAAQVKLAVHGCIFETEPSSVWRNQSLKLLAEALNLEPADVQTATFQQRARLFLVDHERGQDLAIRVGTETFPLPASAANGHFQGDLTVKAVNVRAASSPRGERPAMLRYTAVTPVDDARTFIGRIHLIPEDGWSVISDIDDTIKQSNVLDKKELIRNTFLREFRAVESMADVYRRWQDEGAVFHYVSGSPWQLYPLLAQFAEAAQFPLGAFHLRHFRLHDRSSLDLLRAPQQFKLETIEPILHAFPNRKFVLVGDSGEQDPEVYGELARRRGGQIAWILIRNITDEVASNERMRSAFRETPAERVVLFHDPKGLPDLKLKSIVRQ